MSYLKKYILQGFFLCFISFFMTATYATTTRDFQSWLNLTLTGHFNQESKDFSRFRYWLEGQERLGDDSSRISQTLARIGLGYDVTKNMSFWFGYAWIHTAAPFTTQPFSEDRIWEQLIWRKQLSTVQLISRTRMEQRFLEGNAKTAYRIRQLIKLVKPLETKPQLSLVASDEVFWHKNDFIGQNGQGFDQNRVFVGFGYQFSPVLQTEVGYMNQYIRRFGVPNFLNNILSINLAVNF